MARAQGSFRQAWGYYWSRWSDSVAYSNVPHDINNDTAISAADPTDSISIPLVSADLNSRVHLDRAAQLGARNNQKFAFNAAGGLVTQCFFINSTGRTIIVTEIEELHSTAETAAGTATAVVTHDMAGQAPGAGTVVMTNTFNLKATANTVQAGTLLAVDALGRGNLGLQLAPGDRLSIAVGGTATITALAGVVLNVFTAAGAKELTYVYNVNANATIANQSFALANRDLVVTGVYMSWSAAATNGSAVTADITIETGTTAPAGGTTILAAAQSVKGAINTPVSVPLSATAANLILRAGNRLSVKMTGTLTALAGLVIVVTVGPIGGLAYIGESQATFTMNANASLAAAQGFFIADRDYEVVDASAVWATAATDAGGVTYDITIDKGVVAPGSTNSCLATTPSLKGTANTVSVPGINTSRRQRLMSQGDLLTFKTTGTLTALAGVTVTVALRPI